MENRIRSLRKDLGMTQKELGEIVGVKDNTIAQYEVGKREPNIEMWERLAQALNVSPSFLVGWTKRV